MISKILVATDGSDAAKKAVKYAAGLAKDTGAKVILLSVIDKGHLLTRAIPAVAAPTRLIEPVEDYLRQAAEAYIGEAAALLKKKGIRAKEIIKLGHPVKEIVKEAKKSEVDMIIIGSHGLNPVRAAILGSVTFGVIHEDTKIPVLVVRG